MTNVFCAYAQKHLFDEIHTVDIIDCNAGDHGLPFATNFNPEINIREITAKGRYWEDGEWVETEPLAVQPDLRLSRRIGPREASTCCTTRRWNRWSSTSRGSSGSGSG